MKHNTTFLEIINEEEENDIVAAGSSSLKEVPIDMNDKTFSFNVGDELKTFKAHEFKNIFYPAYCITAHVSQGATFKDKYTIHDWNHPRMDLTAKYVSLSRATSINNIQINI